MKPFRSAPSDSSFRYTAILLALFTGIVLVSAIMLAADNILAIGFVFDRNYNEGWNIYNAERLIHHEVIYDDNYWRVNNYPIVSFIVVAGVDFFVHDLLLSGRIVALASFVAIGALAALATRRFGGDPIDAVFSGGCALGFCYLVAPDWIAADDPQTLAEAFMLGGLVAYLPTRGGRNGLLGAAFLVTLAGFTKHNLVAIPLAISLDLALRSPRRLPLWLAACAGSALGFLVLTKLVAGGDFLGHLLSPRIITWYNIKYHSLKFLRQFKFPLLAIAVCSRRTFPGQRVVLAAYGIIAIGAGAVLSGFDGTSFNMFQDAAVFLAIASGVTLHELRRQVFAEGNAKAVWARIALFVACILTAQPILTQSPKALSSVFNARRLLAADADTERAFLGDVAYVTASHGPAICESLLLCYRSGQDFTVDPSNSLESILTGQLDQSELIRRVAAREFAVIQLRAEICDDPISPTCHILHYPRKYNRFADEFLYAVDRSYRIDRQSRFGVFYVPK